MVPRWRHCHNQGDLSHHVMGMIKPIAATKKINGCRHAKEVRLHRTGDEHGIRVLGDGFAKIELKVPRFVTTHRESGAIVPLDEHAWPTELPCDIR